MRIKLHQRTRGRLLNGACGCGALAAAALALAGCGGIVGFPLGTTTAPPTPVIGTSLTGNWQVAVTTTAGAQPFTALTGPIVEETAVGTNPNTLVSIFQAQNPSSCYLGQTAIPSQGSTTTTSLTLTSFSVDNQYLGLTATPNSALTSFTGSFSITDGCASGTKGNVTGTLINPLTGTYTGTVAGTTSALTLTQNGSSDGLGYFHVSGSAAFTGVPCFTSGTLDSTNSTITGQQVTLTIVTNESPSSTVVAVGSLSPDANTLTLSSQQITSGSCASSGGSGTLTR